MERSGLFGFLGTACSFHFFAGGVGNCVGGNEVEKKNDGIYFMLRRQM